MCIRDRDVGSVQDILNRGIYITNAVKTPKTEYAVSKESIEAVSYTHLCPLLSRKNDAHRRRRHDGRMVEGTGTHRARGTARRQDVYKRQLQDSDAMVFGQRHYLIIMASL